MPKNLKRLVIVESPTKAKTIRKFLPAKDFRIEASMGHVRDLPAKAAEIPKKYKEHKWSQLGVDVENGFKPIYIISSGKKRTVNNLKSALKNADELYIATDEDREGESIGWHLLELLKPKVPVKRMVFHEITKEAIENALENTREIDKDLVDAQEARRILDRLVGYSISPLLWRKIAPRLSAGRVQSVAVRLMVNREKERLAFLPAGYWDLKAQLEKNSETFEAVMTHLNDIRLASGRDFDPDTGKLKTNLKNGKDVLILEQNDARKLAQELPNKTWQITKIEEKINSRSPSAPFTTSTLQQEASRKLNLSARDTMRTAQNLYENGLITYMRTDSTNLSQEAIEASRKAILNRYGKDYLPEKPRVYSKKSRNAQEAHEAIRPAGKDMKTTEELNLVAIEAKLYDLIWKRTVASQMQNAKLKFTTATILVGDARFRASGRSTIFPGFFRAYVEGSDDPNQALDNQEQPLPKLQENENLKCKDIAASGHETKPPARFTEASLIKLLEKEGIGRPSTYASIIDTILRRNYSYKSGNQLVPTFMSFAVTKLMENQFDRLVDTNFTALMEQKLDDIADGSLKAVPYLKDFYFGKNGLKARVEGGLDAIDARATSEISFKKWGDFVIRVGRYGPYVEGEIDGEIKTASMPDKIAPSEIDQEYLAKLIVEGRLSEVVAKFPETDEPILLRKGPYGHYLQLGEDETKKPKRISLPQGLEPEDVDAKKAIELISLPRILGENPENSETIKAHIGRFGPYVQEKRIFASIPKDEDLLTISLERALELINQKKNKNKPLRVLGLHPDTNEEVDVRDGRYGPYVKHQKTNASLKKDQTIEDISLEQALILIAEREEAKGTKKPKKRATKRKTTKRKATAKKATAKKSTKKAVKKKATKN